MFLGLEDPVVVAAYLCTIGAAILCVIYGIINWNKGAQDEQKEIEEEVEWEKKEQAISEGGNS